MSDSQIPFRIEHIDHVVFRVRDLDASVAFYRKALGCEVARIREDLGLVHLRAGTCLIDLVSVSGRLGAAGGAPPRADGHNVDHVCLRIDAFDEARLASHLSACGAAPRGPATVNFGAQGQGPSLYFTDPDGNRIELKGPATAGTAGGR
ncbi:MAG: VOC family protein [Lautropia sp.]